MKIQYSKNQKGTHKKSYLGYSSEFKCKKHVKTKINTNFIKNIVITNKRKYDIN